MVLKKTGSRSPSDRGKNYEKYDRDVVQTKSQTSVREHDEYKSGGGADGDEDWGADGGVGVDENEDEESSDEDPDANGDETVFSDVDWEALEERYNQRTRELTVIIPMNTAVITSAIISCTK